LRGLFRSREKTVSSQLQRLTRRIIPELRATLISSKFL
jgi:hypothetical protein